MGWYHIDIIVVYCMVLFVMYCSYCKVLLFVTSFCFISFVLFRFVSFVLFCLFLCCLLICMVCCIVFGRTQADQEVFQKLLNDRKPLLACHLRQIGFDLHFCLTGWFLRLYIGVLPTEITLRIWDWCVMQLDAVLISVGIISKQCIHLHLWKMHVCHPFLQYLLADEGMVCLAFKCTNMIVPPV